MDFEKLKEQHVKELGEYIRNEPMIKRLDPYKIPRCENGNILISHKEIMQIIDVNIEEPHEINVVATETLVPTIYQFSKIKTENIFINYEYEISYLKSLCS